MASRASDGGRINIAKIETIDRVIATGAVLILIALAAALGRGHAQWGAIGPSVWAHIATIAIALALTPFMMLRQRGTRRHRQLGYVWCAAMVATAAISFTIRLTGHGGFSFVHILSVWTLIQVPVIILSARRHAHARHRSAVRGMAIGALLIAGFFTFPFGRLLGTWLFG
ncbi:MAG: hypothetical protein EOP59_07255 [Sphingomonadales bacterium]|nr:MAG: hypothetical protein EOP59_07255 [Sphingomonadales bacterium]